jgi:hypothetical protein
MILEKIIPPFSHQPEDRVLRTARLYGFCPKKQGLLRDCDQ